MIVAKFHDVESGRNKIGNRGTGTAHKQFDIPIARDGGIADLLAKAKRPDRRFVAVVCESIERIARVSVTVTSGTAQTLAAAVDPSPETREGGTETDVPVLAQRVWDAFGAPPGTRRTSQTAEQQDRGKIVIEQRVALSSR